MALPVIAVLSPHRHPRLRYVLSEAGRRLGADFKLFTDQAAYQHATATGRIRYGAEPNHCTAGAEIALFAHSFLAGKVPAAADLVVKESAKEFRLQSSHGYQEEQKKLVFPAFFACPNQARYDPFSMLFYCLSRYEEYQPFTADEHGRFPASASHAFANDYLERPVVDYLLAELSELIGLTAVNNPAFYQATYDIDVPFAYLRRGWRGMAAGIKDVLTGRFQRAWSRYATVLFNRPDPYDTFARLRELHADQPARPRVFFLLAKQSSVYDPSPPYTDLTYSRLIQQVTEWAETGIHPSYYSTERPELIQREKDRLHELTKLPVLHSRQHFLRFTFPATYRELIRAGITHDHSMGYADEIGWRAGTNQSFYWYDLEREKQTHLLVHPFGVMDVTLLRYKDFATLKSKTVIEDLFDQLSPLGGPLTLLWHNSSFANDFGWKGWWEMYAGLIRKKQIALFRHLHE